MQVQKLYFSQAKLLLNYKNDKALIDWADKNDLYIESDETKGQDKNYFLLHQFFEAYDGNTLKNLVKRYGKNKGVKIYYENYIDHNVSFLNGLGINKNYDFSPVKNELNSKEMKGNKPRINVDEEFLKEHNCSLFGEDSINAKPNQILKLSYGIGEKKVKGLSVWCKKGRGVYNGICKPQDKIKNDGCLLCVGGSCKYPEHLTYRLEVRSKNFGRRIFFKQFRNIHNQDEAKALASKIRSHFIETGDVYRERGNKYEDINTDILINLMAVKLAFLKDIGIEECDKKKLEPESISSIIRHYGFMLKIISQAGYDLKHFTIYQLDEILDYSTHKSVRGKIIEEIKKIPGRKSEYVGEVTINDYIQDYKDLFKYGIESSLIDYDPFKNTQKVHLGDDKQEKHISGDEFFKFIETINTNKDAYYITGNKRKERKPLYRDYLITGYRLGLFTGYRPAEIVHAKFGGIILNEDGGLLNGFLIVEDFKKNKKHKITNPDKKYYSWTRINEDLKELLEELDYKKYIGSEDGKEKYIVATDLDELKKRTHIQKTLSKSFSKYMELSGCNKGFVFNHLRHTFLHQVRLKTGIDKASTYKHSQPKTAISHYIGKKSSLPTNEEFDRVF